jgi:hypothetical protein
MLEKIFGIMRRFYYLVATLMTIGYVVNGVATIFSTYQNKMDDALLCFAGAILTFPIAILLHGIAHWIVWGELNLQYPKNFFILQTDNLKKLYIVATVLIFLAFLQVPPSFVRDMIIWGIILVATILYQFIFRNKIKNGVK